MNSLKKSLKSAWRFKELYLLMIPGLAFYAVYKYAPMFGLIVSAKNYQVAAGLFESPWANPWYKHFKMLFSSDYFFTVLRNTLAISSYKLLWGSPLCIAFSLLLNEVRIQRFKRFVQTVTYLPHFLSWVVIYGIAVSFFSETSGVINLALKEYTGRSIPFLTSEDHFQSILVGTEIWRNLGWNSIIYLAAMTGIDLDQYEAANLDGAGRLQKIWHITLPGVKNVVILLLVLQIGTIMDAGFDQVYAMYNVHVYPVADILDTWVYRSGIQEMNFSLAAAAGLSKSMIGLILISCANFAAKRMGEKIW
jgi:putative aldouronate transport system permease protein